MPAVLQKNLLGPKRPYKAFCSLCRPKSLLVTSSRGARHMNDRVPPWSSCPSSVFFVPGGILPVRSHAEGGSSAQSLRRHRCHLGLKIQVDFKGEWVHTRFRLPFLGASHGTDKNTSPIVAQPARSQFSKSDPQNNYKLSPLWCRHIMSCLYSKNSQESQIRTRIRHTFCMFSSGKHTTCQSLCNSRTKKVK